MSAAFTTGPWRVSKGKARRVTNAHGVVICNAVLRNQGGPKHKANLKDEHEAEANADLIAAAPDLFEALEAIWVFANDTLSGRVSSPADTSWYRDAVVELRNRARAALAKAKGESPHG